MINLFFLVYDGRSGSTLLASQLYKLKDISVIPETSFISIIYNENLDFLKENNLEYLLDELYKEVQFTELNINREFLYRKLIRLNHFNKKEIVLKIIESYFGYLPVNVLIKHNPFTIYKRLKKDFNNIKIINLIRDGRAILLSKLNSKNIYGKALASTIISPALNYIYSLRKMNEFENSIYIRYEDLILNNEKTLYKICKFLDIKYEFEENGTDYFNLIGKKQKHLHINIKNKPDKNKIYAWKNKLKPEQIGVYQIIAGGYLKKYGYKIYPINGAFIWIRILSLFVFDLQKTIFQALVSLIKTKKNRTERKMLLDKIIKLLEINEKK